MLFPARPDSGEAPITKREVIAYFARVAPAMLGHLHQRPVNLHRFPHGLDRPGFWQKAIPASAPGWLTRWRETGLSGDEQRAPNDHLVVDGVAALAWLGNQAAFEVHAWTSTVADPWRPTFALIDIDPGTSTAWEQTLTLARLYRTALDHLGVRGYPKTTGSRGLQVWIPVTRGRYEYAQTSAWVEALSRAVGATVPDLVSWQWATKERGGRARLDYTQNAPIKTLVAPYAIRPRPGARSRCQSRGRNSTIRTCAAIGGRSATRWTGSSESVTCSPGPRPTTRSCRPCEAAGIWPLFHRSSSQSARSMRQGRGWPTAVVATPRVGRR